MTDRLHKIVKSTPFRICVLFTVFYLSCFSIGEYIFYKDMTARFNQQIDHILGNRFAKIEELHDNKGLKAVEKFVRSSESDNPKEYGVGYQYTDSQGNLVADSFSGFKPKSGYQTVAGSDLGFSDTKANFRLYSSSLGNAHITLGINPSLRDDLTRSFFRSFLLTMLLTTVLAMAGSMFLAYRSNERIGRITRFMEGVGTGNLKDRLPVSHSGDGIDRLSADINNAISLLQRKVSGMKQVSNNIAHDLKTPLNRLNIKAEEALQTVDADHPAYDKLEAVSTEAQEINTTFEQLLHIAQLESDDRKARFTSIDLVPLCSNLCEIFSAVAEDNDQQLALDLRNDPVWITGDSGLVTQLISCLIENSLNHCDTGTKIVVSVGIQQDTPWLSVSDNGVGIPEAELPLLFDPLYRLEKSRTTKGAGLGLTLVKTIAGVHDSEVVLSNNHPGLNVTINFKTHRP